MASDGSWAGDACDNCGVPTCSACLSEILDIKGEWQLCTDCSACRTSVRCDFRQVPPAFWSKLYAKFEQDGQIHANRDGDTGAPTGTKDQRRQEAGAVVESRQVLDSRFDYMTSFLEQDVNNMLKPDFRKQVLDKIKATMIWKSQQLSATEVDGKVEELDFFMQEALKNAFS